MVTIKVVSKEQQAEIDELKSQISAKWADYLGWIDAREEDVLKWQEQMQDVVENAYMAGMKMESRVLAEREEQVIDALDRLIEERETFESKQKRDRQQMTRAFTFIREQFDTIFHGRAYVSDQEARLMDSVRGIVQRAMIEAGEGDSL